MKGAINTFDVLVLYSGSIAKSSVNKKYKEKFPFSSKQSSYIYNVSYQYFLEHCKTKGIKAAFAVSDDIIGPGLFKSFWTYDKRWIRNSKQAHSNIIFDKFSPETKKQEEELKVFTSSKDVYLFNKKKLTDLFLNKLNTYKNFPEFTIPTVEIMKPTRPAIALAKCKLDKLLKAHNHSNDYNNGYLVKDKTGFGGQRIFKVDFKKEGMQKIEANYLIDSKNKKILSYLLQPFIDGSNGFSFEKYSGFIDLRIIMLNKKIIQTYIRVAKKGHYKCNEHQGGNLVYMANKTIPKDVLVMVKKIVNKLENKLNLKHSLYALDFIKSNNGNLYFIEGNNNPGIDWDPKKAINKRKSKELIDIIINELQLIINEKLNYINNPV